MFRNLPRRAALLGVLLALAGCPGQLGTAGIGGDSTGTASSSVQPNGSAASKVANLTLDPTNIELNAPYSYGGYQSETDAALSEREVAGYPTSARLLPTFLGSDGKRTAAAELDWLSSHPELVAVDQSGWIRSVDPGTSGNITIIARLKSDPTISATASVVLRNDGKLSLELK